MKYLYGDSAPFPLGYNFLLTLEAFMTAATRIVELDTIAGRALGLAQESALVRQRGIDSLEVFHNELMRAVNEAAADAQHTSTVEYAQRVGEFAARIVDDYRRAAAQTNESEQTSAQSEVLRARGEIRAKLDGLFKVARLPVQEQVMTLRLGEGKDASYDVSCVLTSTHGIVSTFRLGAPDGTSWTRPRRVSELASGMEPKVGVKKSWLKGTVTAEKMRLDNWIVGDVTLRDDSAEIALRKKAGEPDTLVLRVRQDGNRTVVEADHPGDTSAEAIGGELDAEDADMVERLVLALRVDVKELLPHKEELLAATINGADVLGGEQVLGLIARLVEMFTPTVIEITRRSPSPQELSLKAESDGGRREELYLRKEELVKKLQPLSAAGRQIFAPLGLDTWVPATTIRPPPVG